jgi:enoyl-CoA hydratase/carnithine racemase
MSDSSAAVAAPEPVQFERLPAAGGHAIGVATLASERTLHALNLPMIRLLDARLRAWAADPAISCVVLAGGGDKAFSAGGDVKWLARAVAVDPQRFPHPDARAFFTEEYRLDHLIHRYPKPLLAWGGGIVMGGGMGLFVGASHRVVTETTRAAMPEIGIGLFPDVGGSWFLRRLPGRAGLYAGLTGAGLNAADLLHGGLADVALRQADRAEVIASLANLGWTGDAAADRARLGAHLAAWSVRAPATLPASKLVEHAATIERLCSGATLAEVVGAITGCSDDVWLAKAGQALAMGSPMTAALVWAVWQRAAGMGLADVFRMELVLALRVCAAPDFREGVRALLIDKDHAPRWSPALLAAIDEQAVSRYFEAPPWAMHPLADLRD